jgi:TatD DNase family protein
MRLIDSHCHIDGHEYDPDRKTVIDRARAAGVEHVVVVGLWRDRERVASARLAVEVAAANPGFASAAVCIHPHDAAAAPEADFQEVEALCGLPAVVAVGETGLDYHYDHSPREVQQVAFRRFVRLAHQLDKPLVIHTREAEDDTYRILDEERVPARGAVIHCFTGDRAAVKQYLNRGLLISFSGIVTFRTAEEIREAARLVPLDRMLVETDAPFLAPVPHRGKRNEPAWVARVVETLAAARGVAAEELAAQTAENARRFFNLPAA